VTGHGPDAGLSAEELERIVSGPQAGGWSQLDSALLLAAVEPPCCAGHDRDTSAAHRPWTLAPAPDLVQQLDPEHGCVRTALLAVRVAAADLHGVALHGRET
jgi:hypothetical protein